MHLYSQRVCILRLSERAANKVHQIPRKRDLLVQGKVGASLSNSGSAVRACGGFISSLGLYEESAKVSCVLDDGLVIDFDDDSRIVTYNNSVGHCGHPF